MTADDSGLRVHRFYLPLQNGLCGVVGLQVMGGRDPLLSSSSSGQGVSHLIAGDADMRLQPVELQVTTTGFHQVKLRYVGGVSPARTCFPPSLCA